MKKKIETSISIKQKQHHMNESNDKNIIHNYKYIYNKKTKDSVLETVQIAPY